MGKTTYIYTLIDPRNQSNHYIGKTVQNPPQKRLQQHLLKPATEDLRQWLNQLQQLGLKPELHILEEVPPNADWRAAEIYWVRYGLTHNWSLKNRASGGDNYPLELLNHAQEHDIIPRVIYGKEQTFRLLTSINAYLMKGKRADDNTFRDLFY
jgi:GIY-YIG catalytic domain